MSTKAGTALAAIFAATVLGCGSEPKPRDFEPRADHRSDPLSPADSNAAVDGMLMIDLACNPLPEDQDAGDIEAYGEEGSGILRGIAVEHPHAVLSKPPAGFSGDDTMIQALERIAHMYDDCRYGRELGALAKRLRER